MTKTKQALCEKAAQLLLREVVQYDNPQLENNFVELFGRFPNKELDSFVFLLRLIPPLEDDDA